MALNLRIEVDLRGAVDSLEAVADGLGSAVRDALREAAAPILTQAIADSPYDPTHRGWKGWHSGWRSPDPGHIKNSLELRNASYGVALVSSHPGAPVHEYGGTISPAGHPITIQQAAFAQTAGETQAGRVESRADNAIDVLLREHGF